MSAQEIKVELSLDVATAARFFRNFADALEGGDEKPLNEFGISIQESKKIKLGIKRKLDAISLKVKVRNPLPAVPGTEDSRSMLHPAPMPSPARLAKATSPPKDDSGSNGTPTQTDNRGPKKPGYKSLKKRLGKSFKNMKKSLLTASPPVAGDLSLFLEDSAAMLDYPGYGDEYYAAYAHACNAFKKAVAGGDMEEMLSAFNKIGALKSACHERYK